MSDFCSRCWEPEGGAYCSEHGAVRRSFSIAGGYRVDELIGVGARTVVACGHRLEPGVAGATATRVAVKLLRPAVAADPEARQRFLREAEALRLLIHPHVIRVIDSGWDDQLELAYLVMDREAGQSADVLIKQQGPLSWRQTVPLLIQLCRAVSAAHAAGINDGELTAGKVFLVAGVAGRIAKLRDFGLSRKASAGATASDDVYGIGTVAHELVSGRPPLEGSSPAAMLSDDPIRINERFPALALPAALDDLIRRCRLRDPLLRPSPSEIEDGLLALGVPAPPRAPEQDVEATAIVPELSRQAALGLGPQRAGAVPWRGLESLPLVPPLPASARTAAGPAFLPATTLVSATAIEPRAPAAPASPAASSAEETTVGAPPFPLAQAVATAVEPPDLGAPPLVLEPAVATVVEPTMPGAPRARVPVSLATPVEPTMFGAPRFPVALSVTTADEPAAYEASGVASSGPVTTYASSGFAAAGPGQVTTHASPGYAAASPGSLTTYASPGFVAASPGQLTTYASAGFAASAPPATPGAAGPSNATGYAVQAYAVTDPLASSGVIAPGDRMPHASPRGSQPVVSADVAAGGSPAREPNGPTAAPHPDLPPGTTLLGTGIGSGPVAAPHRASPFNRAPSAPAARSDQAPAFGDAGAVPYSTLAHAGDPQAAADQRDASDTLNDSYAPPRRAGRRWLIIGLGVALAGVIGFLGVGIAQRSSGGRAAPVARPSEAAKPAAALTVAAPQETTAPPSLAKSPPSATATPEAAAAPSPSAPAPTDGVVAPPGAASSPAPADGVAAPSDTAAKPTRTTEPEPAATRPAKVAAPAATASKAAAPEPAGRSTTAEPVAKPARPAAPARRPEPPVASDGSGDGSGSAQRARRPAKPARGPDSKDVLIIDPFSRSN